MDSVDTWAPGGMTATISRRSSLAVAAAIASGLTAAEADADADMAVTSAIDLAGAAGAGGPIFREPDTTGVDPFNGPEAIVKASLGGGAAASVANLRWYKASAVAMSITSPWRTFFRKFCSSSMEARPKDRPLRTTLGAVPPLAAPPGMYLADGPGFAMLVEGPWGEVGGAEAAPGPCRCLAGFLYAEPAEMGDPANNGEDGGMTTGRGGDGREGEPEREIQGDAPEKIVEGER